MEVKKQLSLDHIVLNVSSFGEAADFYRVLFQHNNWIAREEYLHEPSLGFQSENGLTLWIEPAENNLAISNRPLNHFAFKCDSREEVDKAYEFCTTQGWEVNNPRAIPEYGDFYGFYFCGPDKMKIEFVTK